MLIGQCCAKAQSATARRHLERPRRYRNRLPSHLHSPLAPLPACCLAGHGAVGAGRQGPALHLPQHAEHEGPITCMCGQDAHAAGRLLPRASVPVGNGSVSLGRRIAIAPCLAAVYDCYQVGGVPVPQIAQRLHLHPAHQCAAACQALILSEPFQPASAQVLHFLTAVQTQLAWHALK